jgi:septal ring factor EnvC (AmiA/AmiB activator)
MYKYSFVFILFLAFMSSCGDLRKEVEDKLNLLESKAESLDSLINKEFEKVIELDSLLKKETEKVKKLDSIIEKSASRIDSVLFKN